MLKRFLPLLFVVLVVLATAVVYLALRDDDAMPPATGEVPAAEFTTSADGLREFRVESEAEFQQVLATLGTSNEEIEAWARTRGFPPGEYTGTLAEPLQHNYAGERPARLRAMAQGGDSWAMQYLAARIARDQPQEAIGWYRQAAVQGSALAAFQLATLYHSIARWVLVAGDDRAELAAIIEREDPVMHSALAWALVAEYEAGLPPGAMSAALAGFQAQDDAIDQACRRGATLLDQLRAERTAAGIAIPQGRPPLAVELPPEEVAGYCAPELFPRADFSGCETFRLAGDSGAVVGHRCR